MKLPSLSMLALAAVLFATQGPGRIRRLPLLTPEQQEILSHLSIVYLPDGAGETVKTIRLSSANLQIVNGLGATNGFPADPMSTNADEATTNGLGNLIVGYNELLGISIVPCRTGSHNVVLGQCQGYESYGGVLAGRTNAVTAPYSSILGGEQNRVDGGTSAIVGGRNNRVSIGIGFCYSTIGGGADNEVTGPFASIAGGQANRAEGDFSAVGGGQGRTAAERFDWAAGSLYEDE